MIYTRFSATSIPVISATLSAAFCIIAAILLDVGITQLIALGGVWFALFSIFGYVYNNITMVSYEPSLMLRFVCFKRLNQLARFLLHHHFEITLAIFGMGTIAVVLHGLYSFIAWKLASLSILLAILYERFTRRLRLSYTVKVGDIRNIKYNPEKCSAAVLVLADGTTIRFLSTKLREFPLLVKTLRADIIGLRGSVL